MLREHINLVFDDGYKISKKMFIAFWHSVQHMVVISLFWSFGSTCNFSIQFIPIVFHVNTSNYIYNNISYVKLISLLTCPRWILPNKLTLLQNLTYPIINLKGYINYLTSANNLGDHNFFGPLCVIESLKPMSHGHLFLQCHFH